MATDTDVYNWLQELGMKVEKVTTGNLYFHITVSPPVGEGVKVSIFRHNPNSTFYVITTVVDIDKERVEQNPGVLKDIKLDLIRMNVEFFFIPPNERIPRSIQVAKIAYMEGLTKNELLEKVTLVKNAAFLIGTRLFE